MLYATSENDGKSNPLKTRENMVAVQKSSRRKIPTDRWNTECLLLLRSIPNAYDDS